MILSEKGLFKYVNHNINSACFHKTIIYITLVAYVSWLVVTLLRKPRQISWIPSNMRYGVDKVDPAPVGMRSGEFSCDGLHARLNYTQVIPLNLLIVIRLNAGDVLVVLPLAYRPCLLDADRVWPIRRREDELDGDWRASTRSLSTNVH